MCHEHMLIQDPRRLLESEDQEDTAEQSSAPTGTDEDEPAARWSIADRLAEAPAEPMRTTA